MQSTSETDLSTGARLRASIVGTAVGIVAGCSGALWRSWPERIAPQGQVLALLLAAGFAGLVSALILPEDLKYRDVAFGIAVRKGLRAGVVAVLVAGCVLSLGARSAALGAPTSFAEMALKGRMWTTLLVSLTAIMPGFVCGFVGAAFGSLVAARFVPLALNAPLSSSLPQWSKWLSPGVLALACVGMLSPITFIGRAPKVDPPPPVVTLVRAPPPPVPPPFHFVAAPEFATAKLGQIDVDTVKTIEGVASQSPMSFTPDYTTFAFCDRSRPSPAVTIFDLDGFKPIASIAVPSFPTRNLAWSPDLKRLACVISSDAGDARIWILDGADHRATALPRPKNGDLPGGTFYWWSEQEIAFFPSDESPLVFDLETLLLKPTDSSAYLAKADETTKKRWLEGPRPKLPTFSRWTLGITDLIEQNTPPPRRKPDAPWRLSTQAHWAFIDPQTLNAHVLKPLPVTVGMRCYCPPDASKLILVHDQWAEVAYMKLTPPPPCCIEVEMPMAFEGMSDSDAKSQVSKRNVCAFAYRPLINPLNGRAVGPDHDQVRATLRLQDWTAGRATFVITQYVGPLDPTDVVATLHTWDSGSPVAWKASKDAAWWTVAGSPLQKEVKEGSAPLETPANLKVDVLGSSFVVVAQARSFLHPTPKAATVELSPISTSSESDRQAALKAFVERHHNKASRGDIPALMDDYGQTVQYLGKTVALGALAKEESDYHQHWPKVIETVVSPIEATAKDSGFTVRYTIEYRTENAVGAWASGKNDVELFVTPTARSFQIEGQSARLYDRHSSQDAGLAKPQGIPVVAATLPKPCWIGSFRMNGATDIECTDCIHLANGGADIHRTYRLIRNGKVEKWCRAELDGTVSQSNGGIQIYIGHQGWFRGGGDKDFVRQMAPSAGALVGNSVSFGINGNELFEPTTGTVMKPVK